MCFHPTPNNPYLYHSDSEYVIPNIRFNSNQYTCRYSREVEPGDLLLTLALSTQQVQVHHVHILDGKLRGHSLKQGGAMIILCPADESNKQAHRLEIV